LVREEVILLVEDDPDDEFMTRRALEKNNLCNEVVVAHDGEQALDYLFGTGSYEGRDTTVMPQVILLDWDSEGGRFGGTEAHKVRREDEALPVVVLTSSGEEQDRVESYVRGANSFVQKPVDFVEFAVAVQSLGMYWFVLNETSES
jgi:DNA-binding response OmpR family regulator